MSVQNQRCISFTLHSNGLLILVRFFVSGPLMIITQKVTSLAFCIHDGIARAESDLSKSQKNYAIKKIPSALEYFGYALQFPTLMAGPLLFYKDYMDFIDGKNLLPTPPPVSNLSYYLYSLICNER